MDEKTDMKQPKTDEKADNKEPNPKSDEMWYNPVYLTQRLYEIKYDKYFKSGLSIKDTAGKLHLRTKYGSPHILKGKPLTYLCDGYFSYIHKDFSKTYKDRKTNRYDYKRIYEEIKIEEWQVNFVNVCVSRPFYPNNTAKAILKLFEENYNTSHRYDNDEPYKTTVKTKTLSEGQAKGALRKIYRLILENHYLKKSEEEKHEVFKEYYDRDIQTWIQKIHTKNLCSIFTTKMRNAANNIKEPMWEDLYLNNGRKLKKRMNEILSIACFEVGLTMDKTDKDKKLQDLFTEKDKEIILLKEKLKKISKILEN